MSSRPIWKFLPLYFLPMFADKLFKWLNYCCNELKFLYCHLSFSFSSALFLPLSLFSPIQTWQMRNEINMLISHVIVSTLASVSLSVSSSKTQHGSPQFLESSSASIYPSPSIGWRQIQFRSHQCKNFSSPQWTCTKPSLFVPILKCYISDTETLYTFSRGSPSILSH